MDAISINSDARNGTAIRLAVSEGDITAPTSATRRRLAATARLACIVILHAVCHDEFYTRSTSFAEVGSALSLFPTLSLRHSARPSPIHAACVEY